MLLDSAWCEKLTDLSNTDKTLTLALSGGLDSCVLLHQLVELRRKISFKLAAIHVNHNLSDNAAHWQQFCEEICHQYQVSFQSINVSLKLKSRQSLEEVARDARYQALMEHSSKQAILATAQHQDDQVETFLIRLKRGSGVKGLAAMQDVSHLPNGQILWRPLLKCSRNEIEQYAKQHQLTWVEDESNQDDQFDRNFLRNQVLPLLNIRWLKFNDCVARTTALCNESNLLADDIAQIDANQCITAQKLKLVEFLQLAPHRQNNLLRYWLAEFNINLPSQKLTEEIIQMCSAKADAQPKVCLHGGEIRRYRSELYFLSARYLHFLATFNTHIVNGLPNYIPLADGRKLEFINVETHADVRHPEEHEAVSIRYQIPSSFECQPVFRRHKRSLKKLWQEQNIPPWLRDKIPYLFYGDEMIAALGYWVNQNGAASKETKGLLLKTCAKL
ncbi:tRNA lysidine(34) synthetase TilS [Catenovulum sediminis]|uniref:tRNA lysidine(34) synthetase TilS n=1 Tax=Catenovulum sediminis TaxID=1740262 RepID=UPI0011810B62|nr:tRNA lysidine(34) synthetase TilS [Catenovulum sediminis]